MNALQSLQLQDRGLVHALARMTLLGGLLGAAASAWALDFSAEATSAIRGQPLHLRLTLRTEGGEVLRPECIRADVVDGERLLSGPDVAVRLHPEAQAGRWTATLVTHGPITQASQKVTLSVGCAQKLWRRYTLKALPSPEQASQLPPTPAPPAAQSGLAESGGWWGGAAGLALLAAAWVWRTRRRGACTTWHPTKPLTAPSPLGPPSARARFTAASAPDQRSAPLLMRPRPPAAAQPSLGSADQDPERPWPEVETQANALAAQGQWRAATALVTGHVRSARRAHLMPYLKLLQLQRQGGDRDAFDDTRTLMEQNFKLHAPRWSGRRCSLPSLDAEKAEQAAADAKSPAAADQPRPKIRRSSH